MAIYTILKNMKDRNTGGDDCLYNGSLAEFLRIDHSMNDDLRLAFANILAKHQDAYVCYDFHTKVNRDSITNQIIQYRDIFKLNGKPVTYPYIVYASENEVERGLLVLPYEKNGWLYAKGYYLCLCEPGSEFNCAKNEMAAICSDQPEMISDAFHKLFTMRAGALQRKIDHHSYHMYDQLEEAAVKATEEEIDLAKKTLPETEDRSKLIAEYVIHWFVLKKLLYVQYMVNKQILQVDHQGDVKSQRRKAREYAAKIPFISYSDMWRMEKISGETA